MSERLARIESLIEQQTLQIQDLRTREAPFPERRSSQATSGFHFQQSPTHSPSVSSRPEPELPHFLIPKRHAATASSLLSVPLVRSLIGDYPRDIFCRLEDELPLPDVLNRIDDPLPPLDCDTLDVLTEKYFEHVHPHNPMFTPETFKSWQIRVLETCGKGSEWSTAICFCVYAMGSLFTNPSLDLNDGDRPDMHFFQPALKIILLHISWNFIPDIEACQALLLASNYLAYLGRPLHSWKMAFYASTQFLSIMDRKPQVPFSEFDSAEIRVFWRCFLNECDRISEFDGYRSGIEPYGDQMPLPHSARPEDTDNTICTVAEHAIRRLLNRIHCSLYSPEPVQSGIIPGASFYPTPTWHGLTLAKLSALSAELNRQLEEWYTSIPQALRPSKVASEGDCHRAMALRMRYYTAQQLIHRPFVLLLAEQEQQQSSAGSTPTFSGSGQQMHWGINPAMVEQSEVCIDACIQYLRNAAEMLEQPSPYLWSVSQSCMSCFILLWVAECSPFLRRFVPAMKPAQGLVLSRLRRWATAGSSLATEVQIIEALDFADKSMDL